MKGSIWCWNLQLKHKNFYSSWKLREIFIDFLVFLLQHEKFWNIHDKRRVTSIFQEWNFFFQMKIRVKSMQIWCWHIFQTFSSKKNRKFLCFWNVKFLISKQKDKEGDFQQSRCWLKNFFSSFSHFLFLFASDMSEEGAKKSIKSRTKSKVIKIESFLRYVQWKEIIEFGRTNMSLSWTLRLKFSNILWNIWK